MKNLTETCRTCGSETLPESRPTGTVLRGEQREVALVRELTAAEELRERADCRVRELEQAIRAFCKGTVKREVLGSLVGAEAF